MPAKKRPPQPPDRPGDPLETVLHALQSQKALIEEMRSENRITLEAVHTTHHRLGEQIRELREQSDARFDVTIAALRDLRARVGSIEAKVDKLVPLEERVAALERHGP
jgi:hypothetical protein